MLQHQIPPRRRLVAAWALPIIAVALISPLPARADAVSDFYKGKDVRMIISSTVGGGYDQDAMRALRERREPPRASETRVIPHGKCQTNLSRSVADDCLPTEPHTVG